MTEIGERGKGIEFSREYLRKQAAGFLASRGVDFEGVIRSKQNIAIELSFNESSRRGLPSSVSKFSSARYKGVKTGIEKIRLFWEYMSVPDRGSLLEAYMNTAQIVVENLGQQADLEEQTDWGIVVPRDESVLVRNIFLFPDSTPMGWKVERLSMRQLMRRDGKRPEHQMIEGSIDPQVLIDIASLLPDPKINPQDNRAIVKPASGILRQGIDSLIKRWHPGISTPIQQPHKRITIQDPNFM